VGPPPEHVMNQKFQTQNGVFIYENFKIISAVKGLKSYKLLPDIYLNVGV
jgi:hypothetical protein